MWLQEIEQRVRGDIGNIGRGLIFCMCIEAEHTGWGPYTQLNSQVSIILYLNIPTVRGKKSFTRSGIKLQNEYFMTNSLGNSDAQSGSG